MAAHLPCQLPSECRWLREGDPDEEDQFLPFVFLFSSLASSLVRHGHRHSSITKRGRSRDLVVDLLFHSPSLNREKEREEPATASHQPWISCPLPKSSPATLMATGDTIWPLDGRRAQ